MKEQDFNKDKFRIEMQFLYLEIGKLVFIFTLDYLLFGNIVGGRLLIVLDKY